MLQIILMVIGLGYLLRLNGLDDRAAKLAIEDSAREMWRFHRRRQYLWMIAGGWGIAVVSFLVSLGISSAGLVKSQVVQIVVVVLSIIGMLTCAVISTNAGVKADKIERGTWPSASEQDRFDKFAESLSSPTKTDSLANRRVKTLDVGVVVYEDHDLNSPIIPSPPSGSEIQLGASSIVDGREWLEVTLLNGARGYALGPNVRSHMA